MNKSRIAGLMAKIDAVHNLLVEDVNYFGGRGFYGNGPTPYLGVDRHHRIYTRHQVVTKLY